MNVLLVALGGGIGAALRYGVSLLPISGEFPGATLLTNFIGAFVIGLIAAQAGKLPSGPSSTRLGSIGAKLPPQEMRAEISGKKRSRRPITRYSRVPRSS